MDNPQVSVVIPCYNVSLYIQDAIESVIQNQFIKTEIICVDNNSTDNTFDKLKQLQEKHSNIFLYKELRPGANYARNTGLLKCNTDWIQFLDADDILMPNKISEQLNRVYSIKNSTIAFIAGAYIKQSVSGYKQIVMPTNNGMLSVFLNQAGITSSNLWNKNALMSVGGWNENYKSSQETELMFRLLKNNYSFIVDKEPLTIIRQRESGQISTTNNSNRILQYINLRIEIIDYLKSSLNTLPDNVFNELHDFLVVSLLDYANYNSKHANQLFKKYIKSNWKTNNKYGISKLKYWLLNYLGIRTYKFLEKFSFD